ncbi:SDR family NAD(P)-dependent oxidoreductase [Saccharicrinis sp. FJH54]|uniref:SDR family NAD(P)-dependent oxidoreductase n=1 Tax=Saccharicrinis sp. FJH54 TaxID=3344665 RepID=UPI0035D4A678
MKKVAIITGASRGIGRHIALALAQDGYNLALVARSHESLANISEELKNSDVEILPVAVDLEDDTAPEYIMTQTISHFGRLDVLVNNAGIALNRPFAESSVEDWRTIFNVNVKASYFLCQKAVPYLKEASRPVIINIGSVVDHKGYHNQSLYASSKHAVAGYTSALAKEVQELGIRVHLISPGGVNTEMVSKVRPDINTEDLIQPEEIADLVVFLCNYKGKGTIDRIGIRRFNSLAFD